MGEATCDNCGMGFEVPDGIAGMAMPCRFCGHSNAAVSRQENRREGLSRTGWLGIGAWFCLMLVYLGIIGLISRDLWGPIAVFAFGVLFGIPICGLGVAMISAGLDRTGPLVALGVATILVAISPIVIVLLNALLPSLYFW